MARECDDIRVLPEIVEMGPIINIDDGLRLSVQRGPEGVEVGLEWDPSSQWGVLGSLEADEREKWMLNVVQRFNRMVAEGLDGCELVIPAQRGSSGR